MRVELQEPYHIRDMGTASSHALRQSFLCKPKILQKIAVGIGLFNRIEILTLQIFNQRNLRACRIAQRTDKSRHRFKTSQS